MNPPTIHPNTPPRLIARYKKCGYVMRKLAEELDINMFYVSQLITHGVEPTDKTEKGRETRHKLFLTRYKKQAKPHKPLTPIQKAVRKMARATNNAVLIVRVLRKSKEFTGDQRSSSKVNKSYLSRVRTTRP